MNYHYIFDIGGVLINFDIPLLVRHLAQEAGLSPQKLRAVFTDEILAQAETGRWSGEEFFQRQLQPLFPRWHYPDWVEAWAGNYSLNQPGMELRQELQRQGRPVYLLRNQAAYNQLAIQKKFPDFFMGYCGIFLSFELGCLKPELEIYQ